MVDATVQLRAAMPEAAADRVYDDRQTLSDAHERRSSRFRRYQQRSITTTARARRGGSVSKVGVPKGPPQEDQGSNPRITAFAVSPLILQMSILLDRCLDGLRVSGKL